MFKNFALHILGLLLVSFGVVGVIFSGLGAAPVDAFNYFVYTLTPLSLGTIAILTGLVVAAIAFYFNRDPKMIYSIFILFILGICIDLWKFVFELIPKEIFTNYYVSIPFVLLSIILISLGTSLTITTGLPCSPFERLMLVIHRKIHSLKYSKMIIEGTFLILAIIMGILTNQLFSQVNVVTVLLTLLNGPLVGIFTRTILKSKQKKELMIIAAS